MTHAARRRAIRRRNSRHIAINLAGLAVLVITGLAILFGPAR